MRKLWLFLCILGALQARAVTNSVACEASLVLSGLGRLLDQSLTRKWITPDSITEWQNGRLKADDLLKRFPRSSQSEAYRKALRRELSHGRLSETEFTALMQRHQQNAQFVERAREVSRDARAVREVYHEQFAEFVRPANISWISTEAGTFALVRLESTKQVHQTLRLIGPLEADGAAASQDWFFEFGISGEPRLTEVGGQPLVVAHARMDFDSKLWILRRGEEAREFEYTVPTKISKFQNIPPNYLGAVGGGFAAVRVFGSTILIDLASMHALDFVADESVTGGKLIKDPTGRLYYLTKTIGSGTYRIYTPQDSEQKPREVLFQSFDPDVFDVHFDRQNRIWIGLEQGKYPPSIRVITPFSNKLFEISKSPSYLGIENQSRWLEDVNGQLHFLNNATIQDRRKPEGSLGEAHVVVHSFNSDGKATVVFHKMKTGRAGRVTWLRGSDDMTVVIAEKLQPASIWKLDGFQEIAQSPYTRSFGASEKWVMDRDGRHWVYGVNDLKQTLLFESGLPSSPAWKIEGEPESIDPWIRGRDGRLYSALHFQQGFPLQHSLRILSLGAGGEQ